MIFQNHSPINVDNAEKIAEVNYYPDFGHNYYRLVAGGKFHLFHSSNSGMDYGRGTTTTKTYLFGARTLDEVKAWLREKAAQNATSSFTSYEEDFDFAAKMLEALGDEGEEA